MYPIKGKWFFWMARHLILVKIKHWLWTKHESIIGYEWLRKLVGHILCLHLHKDKQTNETRGLGRRKLIPSVNHPTSVMSDRNWTKIFLMSLSDSYNFFRKSNSNDVASWLSVAVPYFVMSASGLRKTWRSSLMPKYGSTYIAQYEKLLK